MEEKQQPISDIDFEKYKTITLTNILEKVENLSKDNVLNPLVQLGYPNIDVEANIKPDEITAANPGINVPDYYDVDGDFLLLRENIKIWMNSQNGAGYLYTVNFPTREANEKGFYSLKKGEKETLTNAVELLSAKPTGALEIPCTERWGGGQIQSGRALSELLNGVIDTKKLLYHVSSKSPAEVSLDDYISHQLGINPLTYEVPIGARVNSVFCSVKTENGSIDDKIIKKHPFVKVDMDYATFEKTLDKAFTQEDSNGDNVIFSNGTLFLNGVKYEHEIKNSVGYATQHGLKIVSVITDSTAKFKDSVVNQLIPNSTYISNEDELAILTEIPVVFKNSKSYIITANVLEGMKKIRQYQKNTPQDVYVTLGDLGSIALSKGGDITWVSTYRGLYCREPNTNGFGDTFAATVSLLEHLDNQYDLSLDAAMMQKVATAVVASKLVSKDNKVDRTMVENIMEYNQPEYSKYIGKMSYDSKNGKASLHIDHGVLAMVSNYMENNPFLKSR